MNKARHIVFLRSILKAALACPDAAADAARHAERYTSYESAIRGAYDGVREYWCRWLVRALIAHEMMSPTRRRSFPHEAFHKKWARLNDRIDSKGVKAYDDVIKSAKRPTEATRDRAYKAQVRVDGLKWFNEALRRIKPYDKKFATK